MALAFLGARHACCHAIVALCSLPHQSRRLVCPYHELCSLDYSSISVLLSSNWLVAHAEATTWPNMSRHCLAWSSTLAVTRLRSAEGLLAYMRQKSMAISSQ